MIHGDKFSYFFNKLRVEVPQPFFVEVGANDGVTLDHIYPHAIKHRLPGIAVEPQAIPFSKLVQNYSLINSVFCENVAIAEKAGTVFMSVEDTCLKSRVSKQGEPAEAMSVEGLSIKHNLRHIDILCVDAEGMDHQIVKWFLDYMFRPSLIQFEHTISTFKERWLLRLRLTALGYRIQMNGMNTIAHLL